MKNLLVILILANFSLIGQSLEEQELYNNSINLVVQKNNNEFIYLDSNDRRLGVKLIEPFKISYLDGRYRNIKTINKSIVKSNVKAKTEDFRNKVVRDGRRVVVYNEDGGIKYKVRKRLNGNIYYKNPKGATIGYKIKTHNEIVYKDRRHRITGRSMLIHGTWIYFSHRNRITPIELINTTYFYSSI